MKKIVQICAIDFTMDKLLMKLNKLSMDNSYEVVGICSNGCLVEKIRREGIKVHTVRIDRNINPVSNIRSIYLIYRILRDEAPDIVHVHTPVASVIGRIASKLAKVPSIIYTAHGFYFHENMGKVKYKIFLSIEKFMALLFTDYIFTQSEEDRLIALENKFIPKEKIKAIGNGVDLDNKFNIDNINQVKIKALYKYLDIKDNDKVVCFIGRLVKEKGILDLLESCKYVKNNIKLLIIGELLQGDRDRQTIYEIEKYKDNKDIKFLGNVDNIQEILYISDIFCLPSYREGMPRSIIEAMSMECAIIATNIRGSREEVLDGKTGYLVDVNSPEIIAEKIDLLLDNTELLHYMKVNGRNRAIKYYDENKVVTKQIEIFDKLSYKKRGL